METSTSGSPAPSTSEPKGFKGLVAKAKLGRKDVSSTNSLNGSSISDEASERGGIRNSVDSSTDKVRDSRISIDDGLPSGPSSLSKLIPGRVKKKRRKREEAEQQLQQETSDLRGRSADGQTATSAMPASPSANNRSRSAFEDEEEDGGSLITVESDTEPSTVSPPPLISHQSHIGFLTSSSPLINTTTPGDASTDTQFDSPTFRNPEYQQLAALPDNDSDPPLSTNLAPDHAATMPSRDGGRNLSNRAGSRSRGVSPGAKIKDVFTVASKKKDPSPPKSPDRTSTISSGSGNALQALFNRDKRSSTNLGRSSKASDSKESVASSLQSPSVSVRDIPAIITTPNTPTSASLDAPETHVTPPTPIDQRSDVPRTSPQKTKTAGAAGINPNPAASSGNTIAHRRIRSDSGTLASSKLSNVMAAPLTPMAEEKTPAVRSPSQGSQAGGFFSSVFSAAQNAANQISSTISNNQMRSRSSTQTIEEDGDEPSDGGPALIAEDAPVDEQKKLAVETLGAGDLSLSHLGIDPDSPPTNNGSNVTFPYAFSEKGQEGSMIQREEATAQAENVSAARAVSQAYSLKPTEELTSTPVAEDVGPVIKPRSVYESSIMTGEKTPPNGSMYEGNNGFRRSGSVRSRVGTIAKRHRNSSSATGGTIAAAIAAGNAALANPAAPGSAPKPTGFAVASKKRNRDFHQLFRSVPEDDYLIEDYSCALQREIILAGRIYISEGHICFSSNILGWVTTLIISFDEIVSVEKESTAVVFPNAIAIQTLHARQTFRSLLSRDATYDLVIGIWKINHPSLKSSLNGVRLEGGTGDKTEKVDPSGSDEASEVSDEEEVYDEDEDDDEATGSFTEVPEGSTLGSEVAIDQPSKAVTRKASAMGVAVGAAAGGGPTPNESKAGEKAAAASAASADFPGPATHTPTECSDGSTHYDRPLQDDIIPAPLGKVYSMIFGAASGGFMAKWLMDEIKVTDLTMEDDKKGLSEETKTRNYSYIKPLNAPIGPKTTKCVVAETLDSFDLEKAVSVTQSTQTPDVPSGNVFATKTHFCMMWAPGNATRLVINFTIEWTGKSWLKGPIEKGANEGQTTYCNDLVKALKQGVTSRSRTGTNGSKVKSKSKRRKGDNDPARTSPASTKTVTTGAKPKDSSWGLFEPLHGILGPVADIFSPMISSNMIIGVLLFIVLINLIRAPGSSSYDNSLAYIPTAQKIAAYEEIWRKEENALWDWLEDRVGMQGLAYPGSNDREAVAQARRQRERSLRDKGLRSRLEDLKMSEKEVDHAIKVTEQKLAVLKRAVQKKEGVQEKMDSTSPEADETHRPETKLED